MIYVYVMLWKCLGEIWRPLERWGLVCTGPAEVDSWAEGRGMVSLIYLKNGLDMTVCLLCVVNGYSSFELFVFYLSPRSSAVNAMIIGVESILKLPTQILNKKKLR